MESLQAGLESNVPMIAHRPTETTASGQPLYRVRPARLEDVTALDQLEKACFDSDRLSMRSFRHLIRRDSASVLVATRDEQLLGYICVLYRRNTALSRIYSIAVLPEVRGHGIAEALMQQAETDAIDHGCTHMRLEVRTDNEPAIRFYHRLGYRQFAALDDYYDDHATALRMEKRIRYLRMTPSRMVPFYGQTTEFTCGPASLLMVMGALEPDRALGRSEELRLWREATTIFMTAGHGGCGPHGLALAAWRRGFAVRLVVNQPGPLFVDSVRDPDKKAVMALVQSDFEQELAATDIVVESGHMNANQLSDCLQRGELPLVLISSWHLQGSKAPHWVVVVAADEHCLYVHDPDVSDEAEASATDNAWLPIPRRQFERMARFGRQGLRATLIISRR